MKDRCLFSIHKQNFNDEDVVEFGVPNSPSDYNCIELWERPDGKTYLRVCGEGFNTDYDWGLIELAKYEAWYRDKFGAVGEFHYKEDTSNETHI